MQCVKAMSVYRVMTLVEAVTVIDVAYFKLTANMLRCYWRGKTTQCKMRSDLSSDVIRY